MGSREAYMAWKEEQDKKKQAEEARQKKEEPKADETAAEKKAAQPARAVNVRQALRRGEIPVVKAGLPRDAGVVAPPTPETLPPLPAPPSDLSRWKERDFLVARLREQPELLDAVARSAAHGPDNEEIVRILTKLLQPEEYAGLREVVLGKETREAGTIAARRTRPSRVTRGGKSYAVQVIESVVDALAQNDTPAARRTLGQLIVGYLATEDNAAAATAALESLVTHPSASHEEMLLRVATEAEKIVAADNQGLSPEALSRRAITLLDKASSPTMRLRVAECLVRNDPPQTVRRALEACLQEMTPENFDAHLLLYLSPGETVPDRALLSQQFAVYSSDALAYLTGLARQDDPAKVRWDRYVAQSLWTNRFALVVEGRLNRLDSWAEEPGLLSLALSLPTDTMRAAVAQRLDVQWEKGPGHNSSGLFNEETLVEPGVLVLLRALLDERGHSSKLPSLVALRTQRSTRGRSSRYTNPTTSRQAQQRSSQDDWAQLAGDLAADWCARCRIAACDRDAAERARGRRIDWSEGLTELPIKPHTTDGVTASHYVKWTRSSEGDGTTPSLDPLALHYVRIEERTKPTRLLAYYGRTLPDHQRRDIEEGVCFEGAVKDGESGLLRSVDVRITRAAPDVRRSPTEEQDLVVEILTVEIRDPAAAALSPVIGAK